MTLKIVNINGPINSGKSTISNLLSRKIANSRFIEVDDFEAQGLSFQKRIDARLHQLYDALEDAISEHQDEVVFFAYPMYPSTFDTLKAVIADRAEFIIVTLTPTLEACLTNRGTRNLDEWEIKRIKEMYKEGVPTFEPSDLFIDNTVRSAFETSEIIKDFLMK